MDGKKNVVGMSIAVAITTALCCHSAVHAGEPCEPHWDPEFGAQHGMNQQVYAMTVFDDGSGGGPALYAGGQFSAAGGVPANNIAKWDGTSWSPLGSGVHGTVQTMKVFDDGTGEALYVGGWFRSAGGVTVNRIAKWDGTSWSPLGSGIDGTWDVRALTVFDDRSGSGPALYAGGGFTTAGGVTVNGIMKWNGTSWSPLGSGLNSSVSALTVFEDGTGEALYAGGFFPIAGGMSVNHIAKWNGTSWSPLGSGMNHGVSALTVFDDGTGEALYAGGNFTAAGGVAADRIAKWDGTSWSSLGSGLNSNVLALTVFDDGTGEALYAGGWFTAAGGMTVNRIAKWDGTSWSPLDSGMNGGLGVSALTVFDDGTEAGPALYAGGSFMTAGDVAVSFIAKWNGCPAEPECELADLNCDGVVDVFDLLILLGEWGECPDPGDCPADLDGNGVVDVFDLLILLANWG